MNYGDSCIGAANPLRHPGIRAVPISRPMRKLSDRAAPSLRHYSLRQGIPDPISRDQGGATEEGRSPAARRRCGSANIPTRGIRRSAPGPSYRGPRATSFPAKEEKKWRSAANNRGKKGATFTGGDQTVFSRRWSPEFYKTTRGTVEGKEKRKAAARAEPKKPI